LRNECRASGHPDREKASQPRQCCYPWEHALAVVGIFNFRAEVGLVKITKTRGKLEVKPSRRHLFNFELAQIRSLNSEDLNGSL
jgi:hypothetical protein